MCFHQFLPKSLDFLLVSLRFFVRKNEIFSFLLLFVAANLKKRKSPNGGQRLLGLQWLLDSTLLGMH